jgi:hypothetical protein
MAHYLPTSLASENRYRHDTALDAVTRHRLACHARHASGAEASPTAAPAARRSLGVAIIRLITAVRGAATSGAASSAWR